MAVTSADEIHDGRDGEFESSKTGSVRQYTRVFRVKTDSNYDEAKTVKAVCPPIGAVYPYDAFARCRRVRASNTSFSKRVWIVTCHYSTGTEIEENPLADPAEIEWVTENYQRIYVKDQAGHWICTTAGELYDPPVEGDDARWTIRIKKNVVAVPTWILTYRNAVNSAAVTVDGVVIAARCAKLSSIRISPVQERNDINFRSLEMGIHTNSETWDKFIENAGFYEMDGANNRKEIVITDSSGKTFKPKKPWPLDANGAAIQAPTLSNVVFNDHRIYPEKDFSVLPLS
jgi:hypothetical protein